MATFQRQATGLVRGISPFRSFVLNIMFTSPAFMLLFLVLGQGLFPGAYLPASSLLALIPALIVAFVYAQLSVAYPRSGGDYVFIGRILHPSVGFMVNFVFTLINISVIGTEAVWITSQALGPMFSAIDAINGNNAYAGVVSTMTTQSNEFFIGALFAIVLPIVIFFGLRLTFELKTVLFAISIVSILAFIFAMLSVSNATFQSNFNSLSSTSYSGYIAAAKSAGANLSYNYNATLLGVVYTVLAVYGFTASTYVGGEVKNPQRSQTLGMVIAPIVYIALMTIVAFVTYSTIGHDFLASVSYCFFNGCSAYTLPTGTGLPTLQFLSGYATKSVLLEWVMGIGLVATLFAYMLSASFTSVRVLFAWSFDSIIPRRFAQVSDRYHVPVYSLAAIIVIDLIFVYATVYTQVSSFFTYVVTGSFIGLTFVGIAALVFPFRRKDVFNSSPSLTNAKLGNVPIVSLLGVAAIVSGILIAYASLLPALVGPLKPEYIEVVVLLFVIGLAFYWISYGIQKARGIPIDKLVTEIPPE